MIPREHYIAQIRPFYDSDLIKVITGIRRCGKSVLMEQILAELNAAGKKTLHLNFERRSVSSAIENDGQLLDYTTSRVG